MKPNYFEVLVLDVRDKNDINPQSCLGIFDTIEQAKIELQEYLNSEYGKHIYKHLIVPHFN